MKARVRELLHAVPFQPFIISTLDGNNYRIDDSGFVMASPNARSWIIIEEADNDRIHQLSGDSISSIKFSSDRNVAA